LKERAMTIAYCYQSGEIGFAESLPTGVLPIAKGPDKALRDFIGGVSRHAYDGETLLVPGIPEAEDESKALDALLAFSTRISKGVPEGVETLHSKHRKLAGL
jgi:hypothetical protein